ncbi:MAG: glycosyltransferase family 4 protein, partial [Acidobacteriota bacterium]|nr:glycosyltransferase family 4 protein [Acidobacteriota bacterium]
MRILWVKAGKLLPVDTGGKIRSYNLLQQLAARQETTLLSYYGGQRDEAYEQEIKRHLPGAVTIHTGAPDSHALEQGLDYVRHLPSRAPYAVTKFTAPAVRRVLAEWLEERRFNVAVCDFLSASLNFPRTLHTPSVLFQHNVESALWRRQADYETNPIKRLVFKLEAAKMLRYESRAVNRFQHVIAVSEHDRELMSGMTDPARISVTPTGVDVRQYQNAAALRAGESTSPLVLFLGSMDWEANIDGVDYFCREVWPAVLAAVPEARFRIVGRNPHSRVLKLASDSVAVTGTVPSVVEHLHEATVFVVPLRVGGGTRLKIFEAMAAGKAVVSTTVGAEGLDVRHAHNIWLADDAANFARAVTTLLRDHEQRRRFEKAAVELAARYDWTVIA